MEELYLVYVNKIGRNHKGRYLYEFIFSNEKNRREVDGDDWDVCPASGRPSPPNEIFIKSVGTLETTLKLDVIQDSDLFAVWDSLDGLIALAYENINDYEMYPDKRIHFHFGLSVAEVSDKLYDKDLVLKFKK